MMLKDIHAVNLDSLRMGRFMGQLLAQSSKYKKLGRHRYVIKERRGKLRKRGQYQSSNLGGVSFVCLAVIMPL